MTWFMSHHSCVRFYWKELAYRAKMWRSPGEDEPRVSAWAFFGHNFRVSKPSRLTNLELSELVLTMKFIHGRVLWNFWNSIFEISRSSSLAQNLLQSFHKLLVMIEKVKTMNGYYFLLPDFKSRGHPRWTCFSEDIHYTIDILT